MTEFTRIGRERLPDRRPSITVCAEGIGCSFSVTLGFANDGRVLEIFARAVGKHDSDQDRFVDDVAVLLSRLLQHGDSLQNIAAGLGSINGQPISPVGIIVRAALDAAKEIGATNSGPIPKTIPPLAHSRT